MIPQRSARALVARTCRCHPEAIAWTRYAVTLDANRRRPQSQAEGMAGQLGQVTLDVAEGVMRWRVWSAFLNRSAASSSAHSITRTASDRMPTMAGV